MDYGGKITNDNNNCTNFCMSIYEKESLVYIKVLLLVYYMCKKETATAYLITYQYKLYFIFSLVPKHGLLDHIRFRQVRFLQNCPFIVYWHDTLKIKVTVK